jgi:hypothetical protein
MPFVLFSTIEISPFARIKARFSNMQIPLQYFTKNSADLETRVIDIRDNVARDIMLQDLQIEFQNRYPNTVAQFVQYVEGALDQRKQRATKQFAATGINSITPPVGYDQIFDPMFDGDLNDYTSANACPQILYGNTAPINGATGTHAGLASNGVFLIDGTHQMVYEQRGSLASPTWELWDTTALPNYLLNPSVLYLWGASLTVQCCLEDAQFRDGISADKQEYLDKRLLAIYKTVASDRARALQLLKVDSSLDGSISEFERTAFTNSDWFEG